MALPQQTTEEKVESAKFSLLSPAPVAVARNRGAHTAWIVRALLVIVVVATGVLVAQVATSETLGSFEENELNRQRALQVSPKVDDGSFQRAESIRHQSLAPGGLGDTSWEGAEFNRMMGLFVPPSDGSFETAEHERMSRLAP